MPPFLSWLLCRAEAQKQHPKALAYVVNHRWVPDCKVGTLNDGPQQQRERTEYVDAEENADKQRYWEVSMDTVPVIPNFQCRTA